jgi:hypothetical protein
MGDEEKTIPKAYKAFLDGRAVPLEKKRDLPQDLS